MNIDDVLSGTFKGVSFLMASGSVSGGNKNVVHAFPNSNRQTVENLGQTPRSYPITMLLPSTNYESARDALLAVLENGTPGPLVHPLYGRIEDVIPGPYTLSEDMTSLGTGTITVTFYIDNGPAVPERTNETTEEVVTLNEDMNNAASADFADKFEVTPSYLNSFESATESVQDAALAFKKSLAPIDQLSEYINAADELSSEVAALITAPTNLATQIIGMYNQALGLFDDPRDALKHYSGFFGHGGTITEPRVVTAAQIQALDNKKRFNALMNIAALGYAYQVSVQIDFETVTDIDATIGVLESQYDAVIDLNTLDVTTREALTDLRQVALAILNEQKILARREVDYFTPPTTARLLAFRHYGNDDEGETIAAINGGNVSNLSGNVKVLTV